MSGTKQGQTVLRDLRLKVAFLSPVSESVRDLEISVGITQVHERDVRTGLMTE